MTMTTKAKKPVRTGKYTWDTAMILRTFGAWFIALLMFFPILFMILTSFKTELQAIAVPSLWIFEPTLENYTEIQERSDYFSFAWNSVLTSVASTILGLAIATPAAYSMAFNPTKQTKNILVVWTTKQRYCIDYYLHVNELADNGLDAIYKL